MKDCEKVQNDLKAYQDGQLPPAPRLAVRWHLARCASCREEITHMENISKELRAEDAGILEPALRARILASIPDGVPEAPDTPAEKPKRWRKPLRKPLILWGATAAAALIWLVFYPAVSHVGRRMDAVTVGTSVAKTAAPSAPPAAMPMNGRAVQDHDEVQSKAPPPAREASGDTTREAAKRQTMLSARADIGLQANAPVPRPAPAVPVETRMRKVVGEDPFAAMSSRADPFDAKWKSPPPPKAIPSDAAEGLVSIERKVHKEADITLEVDRAEAKSETVAQMVTDAGGYVANNQIATEEDGTKTASLTTKIPVGQFDPFLSKLSKLGEVKAKNVNGEDITERMSDTQQLSRTLQQDIEDTAARLREWQPKAQARQDAETLRDLRIRRAQAQARLEMLKKLGALSTVTVQLTEKPKPPVVQPQGGFLDEMRDTGQAAVHSFITAAKLPVMLLIWLLAYSPVWLLLAFAYRHVVRS
jgi:anti-sigma factor RsiW